MVRQDWMTIVAGEDLVDCLSEEIKSGVLMTGSGRYESESLVRVQEQQERHGILGAQVVKSIYGWSVRYDSGLKNFGVLAGSRMGNISGSLNSAINFARSWVSEDPVHRYAWMQKQGA